MPAILTSTLTNHRRSIKRATATPNRKKSKFDRNNMFQESDNYSYGSCGPDYDSSSSSSFISPSRSNSCASTSSFFSLSSNSRNETNYENSNKEWGYFVDVTVKDEEIERHSRVLTSRNKSRTGLVRQTMNLENALNKQI